MIMLEGEGPYMDIQINPNLAIITPTEEMLFLSNAEELRNGLGKILVFNKRLQENKGSLKIRNVNSSYVRNLFSILKLPEIMEIEGM